MGKDNKRRIGKEEDIMKVYALGIKQLKAKILRYGLKTPAAMTRDFISLQKYRVTRAT